MTDACMCLTCPCKCRPARTLVSAAVSLLVTAAAQTTTRTVTDALALLQAMRDAVDHVVVAAHLDLTIIPQDYIDTRTGAEAFKVYGTKSIRVRHWSAIYIAVL